MGLTLNLVQLNRKKREDGKIPIYIRITENRRSRYLTTGIAVLPEHWLADDQKISSKHPHSDSLNFELDQIMHRAEEKRLELRREDKLTSDLLKKQISKKDYNTLMSHVDRYIKVLDQDDRYWEHKHFKVLKNNLESFLGNRTVSIDKVDAELLEDFQRFLLTEVNEDKDGNKYGNSPNTARRKMQRLHGLFNHAIKTNVIKFDPFRNFEIVSKQPVEKTKLSIKQIKSIKDLTLERGSTLWHSRNYFLYSFYNAGIRFGDLCTLRWDNLIDGRLVYKMHKTGGHKSINQLPPMQRILDYYRDLDNDTGYIFPILDKEHSDEFELKRRISSKNVLVNRDVKELAKKAGIQANVSFHVSRHSFAHHALKNKMDLYSISKSLGHADLKTTEQYLKSFDEDKLDSDMNDLFNDE